MPMAPFRRAGVANCSLRCRPKALAIGTVGLALLLLLMLEFAFRSFSPARPNLIHQLARQKPNLEADNQELLDSRSAPERACSDPGSSHACHYRLATSHMDQEVYWYDSLDTGLPLMRLASDEESADFRTGRAMAWTANQTLAVVAIASNAMPGLRSAVANVNQLCQFFAACRLVFLEVNSLDATRRYLDRLAQTDPRVSLVGCGAASSAAPCWANATPSWSLGGDAAIDSAIRATALRNQLLAHAYAQLKGEPSLLLSLEPQLLWDPWQMPSILQGLYYFSAKRQLDSLCATAYHFRLGQPELYEPHTLAFHSNMYYGDSSHQQVSPEVVTGGSCQFPVKVSSCYQGMAFYRYAALYGRRLLCRRSHGELLSETGSLSRQLSQNFIDPNMRLSFKYT